MISIQQFTFNPWAENTYVLYDRTGECLIIDPGCHIGEEENQLVNFIRESTSPSKPLNTDRMINSAPEPTKIPNTEISEMILIAFVDFFDSR